MDWSQHVNNHFSTMNLAIVDLFDLAFPSSQPIDSSYLYNYNKVVEQYLFLLLCKAIPALFLEQALWLNWSDVMYCIFFTPAFTQLYNCTVLFLVSSIAIPVSSWHKYTLWVYLVPLQGGGGVAGPVISGGGALPFTKRSYSRVMHHEMCMRVVFCCFTAIYTGARTYMSKCDSSQQWQGIHLVCILVQEGIFSVSRYSLHPT